MKIKWFSIIRIVGLLLVLLYHFYIKQLPGGFIGVDIFFTFSGYLITALLIDEYSRDKRINLKRFFNRRFYRIVPPVILMLVVTLPFTQLVRSDFIAGMSRQVLAVLGFVTNYFEILTGGNYEAQFVPHLYVHTWSLAIEVHFYIVWAIVLWGVSRRAKSLGHFRGIVFLTSLALFGLSAISMMIRAYFTNQLSIVYFSSWTHVFPFFIGSMLATFVGVHRLTVSFERVHQSWQTKHAIGTMGVSVVLLLALSLGLSFDDKMTYYIGFVPASALAALMILSARVLHEKTPTKEEPVWITYIANISYGVYLFHWPFYIIFSERMSHSLAVSVTIILSIVFATFSYYFIEPLLVGKQVILFNQWNITPYKYFIYLFSLLFMIHAYAIVQEAPAVGAFEQDMLTQGLIQSKDNMETTREFVNRQKATKYNVPKGAMIIGDSVTLRARGSLETMMPELIVDAKGSRNTSQALSILKNNIANGAIVRNIIIATGVNIIYNYEEELNQIVKTIPDGYHLIFVTPYDGNSETYDDPIAEKHRAYELKLAKQYDFISIADWHEAAAKRPDIWVDSDYIHFGNDMDTIGKGANLYARTILEAIQHAENLPVKGVQSSTKQTK
ncbi:acyltransferase family protein [Atopobacter phocae]|uniref:acyltransferase family protein n=1 Tax=Atopobacter phocae TaxID=136492 RepID=UPI0004710505|nr:acyltransferase family protein [Atopobacter phocae]